MRNRKRHTAPHAHQRLTQLLPEQISLPRSSSRSWARSTPLIVRCSPCKRRWATRWAAAAHRAPRATSLTPAPADPDRRTRRVFAFSPRQVLAPHGCKAYGPLAVMLQLFAEPTHLFDIPPQARRPRPAAAAPHRRPTPSLPPPPPPPPPAPPPPPLAARPSARSPSATSRSSASTPPPLPPAFLRRSPPRSARRRAHELAPSPTAPHPLLRSEPRTSPPTSPPISPDPPRSRSCSRW